jgi:putative transposase
MQRKVPFMVGEFYHIYNRGTDKRNIFMTLNDYNRFVTLLYLCNSTKSVNIEQEIRKGRSFTELLLIERKEQLVDIVAYCLMPNHFHLLISERVDGGVSMFMKKLSTAYSMYFNVKHKRSGALFEGRFKAKHVDDDNYLKYLLSYVHLNPVKLIDSKWKENGISDKIAAKNYLNNYKYSSYIDFLGENRKEKNILAPESYPQYFETLKDFEDFVDEWLTFNEEESL